MSLNMDENTSVVVYLALGSNLGQRDANLKESLRLISERLQLVKVSSIYETEPEGGAKQPPYLNQAGHFTTTLPPANLLAFLKGIERIIGRKSLTGEPREIDIDILFYGSRVINTPELTIPHPRLTKRAFVLIPLSEIAPDLVNPVERKTVKELLGSVEGKGSVKRFKANSNRLTKETQGCTK